MQYSPKLKKAMEEIKAIVKKYDIAAVVVLHNAEGTEIGPDGSIYTEGYTEYLFHINPSYSAATIANDRFQVKDKAAHFHQKRKEIVKCQLL